MPSQYIQELLSTPVQFKGEKCKVLSVEEKPLSTSLRFFDSRSTVTLVLRLPNGQTIEGVPLEQVLVLYDV